MIVRRVVALLPEEWEGIKKHAAIYIKMLRQCVEMKKTEGEHSLDHKKQRDAALDWLWADCTDLFWYNSDNDIVYFLSENDMVQFTLRFSGS